MNIFLIGPAGELALEIKKDYQSVDWEEIYLIFGRPYYFYSVDQENDLEDLEAIKITDFKNKLWLRKYSNGTKVYFEDVYREFTIISKASSNIPSVLDGHHPIIIYPGDNVAFLTFIGLADEDGFFVEGSLFSIYEINNINLSIADYLMKERERMEDASRKN